MSGYQATVTLKQGQVDLKGTISVACPVDWTKHLIDCEETGFDMIPNWNLYQNSILISSDEAHCISCPNADTLQFDMLWPYKADLNGLSLVPQYSCSGEHMDEAITLRTIHEN